MSTWEGGIERLDPKAKINFSFSDGVSTFCDNLQLFKVLGIYDEVERDVLRGYESGHLQYWGIPKATEDHGYYNRSERPKVTVETKVKIDDNSSMGKIIKVKNTGKEPIIQKHKINTSNSEFKETIINLSTAMKLSASTNISVVSASSEFSASFSKESKKQATRNYSKEIETKFTISTGEQLVNVKNPTQITKFKVKVIGKFCLRFKPQYKKHYLWMPQLNEVYDCQVVIKDVGTTSWWVEKISADPTNVRLKDVGVGVGMG